MKIKKYIKFKYKLLKLQLIKSKIYEKKTENIEDFFNIVIEQTELQFKKAINIIYKYHLNQKKIFFVGIPLNFQKQFSKILKKTKHLSIPESIWINGILSNNKAISQSFKLKSLKHIKKPNIKVKKIKPLFYINKKPDLIVLINPILEKNVIEEANKLKIPIIALNSNLFNNFLISYKISGYFKLSNTKTFKNICIILDLILKKTKI